MSEQGLWSRQRGAQEPLDKAFGCGPVSAHIYRQQAGPRLPGWGLQAGMNQQQRTLVFVGIQEPAA